MSATKIVSIEEASAYIDTLDLNYIIVKMTSSNYPLPRWSICDAEHCCKLYKRFLFLQKKYMPTSIIPNKEVDEFWHNHILYTKNYARDCLNIFGHYLHHDPVSPEDDHDALLKEYVATKQIYFNEFNEEYGLNKQDNI